MTLCSFSAATFNMKFSVPPCHTALLPSFNTIHSFWVGSGGAVFVGLVAPPVPEPPVSNVRLAWGKCVTENGKTSLPVTIVAHHALADGIHLAAFFDELKRRLG